jgi:hypothetical protein
MAAASTSFNTGSQYTTTAGANGTRTALSTNIIIEVSGTPVGAIQDINYKETRGIHMVDEVGTDGHIDSAPNKSVEVSGGCQRTRFDDIFQADENVGTNFSSGKNVIVTTLKNVWITDISTAYKATEFIITDSMNFVAETVYSTLGDGSAYSLSTSRKVKAYVDSGGFEQAADIGRRRGALDGAGLINAIDVAVNG